MAAKKSVNTRTRIDADASKSAAKLPHEQDESVGMTDGISSTAMQQAHKDLARGLLDTDRGPEADRAYKKLKGSIP